MEESPSPLDLKNPACRGADARIFDWEPNPSRKPRTMLQLFDEAHAKSYCARCLDRAECLSIGMTPEYAAGTILGAMNPAEREDIRHGRVLAKRRKADRDRTARRKAHDKAHAARRKVSA
jgi:hypothetical protein